MMWARTIKSVLVVLAELALIGIKEVIMFILAFCSIKGGTGKSSFCILLARWLSKAGYRVLLIDLDLQNSITFWSIADLSLADGKNIALALNGHDLTGNILRTRLEGVDILASSFSLANLRAIGTNTLKRLLHDSSLDYDYVIIDCAPTYDNIILNAVNASDRVITPVRYTQFDYKGAIFLRDQLAVDTDRLDSWRVLLNCARRPRKGVTDSLRGQFETLYRSTFGERVLPITVQESGYVQRAIEAAERISAVGPKVHLYEAIKGLAQVVGADREAKEF
jgi:chromosome partitioning protein